MKRLKSIDIFRGISMIHMIFGHLVTWWLYSEQMWVLYLQISLLNFMGAAGFLFVSGISTAISYNTRIIKATNSENYNKKLMRNEYMLRALFIAGVALLFNIVIGWLESGNIIHLWRWYILLTIALSLFFGWPLLKTSKLFRIFVGVGIWIIHKILSDYLMPHEGELNFNGILYYILYHQFSDAPLIIFFSFFVFGTIIGDIIFEISQYENQDKKFLAIKKKLILPTLIAAPILILFGVIYDFPQFWVKRGSFPNVFYALGLEMLLITILYSIEEFELIKPKKSYRFLYYFSYYSLSVFVGSFIFGLILRQQFDVIPGLFCVIGTIILIGLLLRFLHKHIEGKYTILNWSITFSMKLQITRWSSNIARSRLFKSSYTILTEKPIY
ncbi:MAG: heparan-alpha-glucosaminide N-acetyltransferase domain-containing protein [Promethearchaeota archaeon]